MISLFPMWIVVPVDSLFYSSGFQYCTLCSQDYSIYSYILMFQTNESCLFFFFLQTFNTIKKLRESSSSSPVAETEGNIMEEVKAVCNSSSGTGLGGD